MLFKNLLRERALKIYIPRLAIYICLCCALFSLPMMGVTLRAQNTQKNPKAEAQSKGIAPVGENHPLSELFPGEHYSAPDIKKMQKDPSQNPGLLWKNYGKILWDTVDGEEQKACATCHNKAEASMKGVGFRYPSYNEAEKRIITLEDRINLCRQKFMKAPPLATETDEFLGLSMYVRSQSQGLPMKIKIEGPAKPFFDYGQTLYYQKRGAKQMSCATCHEQNVNQKLGTTTLSQGHINGYPAYQISSQKPGTALKRINQCNDLSQAEHFNYGSEDYLALELYLTWRGQGLPINTPALRK